MNVIVVNWCYVRKVGNLLIISFFIVRLQENYVVRFSNCLVLYGLSLKGKRVVGELKKTTGTPYCIGSMEVGLFVFNVVYLERVECKEL
jgi:hypothetical protein